MPSFHTGWTLTALTPGMASTFPEDDTETGLSHRVTCEKVGAATNQYTGQLIPVEYLDGLTYKRVPSGTSRLNSAR